jgi:hypothetical protein
MHLTDRTKRGRWKRDSIIVAFALAGGAYEIILGGGRASVFTFLIGLLLSPLVLRIDESKGQP